MKKVLAIVLGVHFAMTSVSTEALARGGRGGGGGAGRGGFSGGRASGGGGMRSVGSGMSRPTGSGGYRGGYGYPAHTPSMSRPTNLPSSYNQLGGVGNRSLSRTNFGNLPTPGVRPIGGINTRPAPGGVSSLPSRTQPSAGIRPPTNSRPATAARPVAGNRPASTDVKSYLNLPTSGGTLAGSGQLSLGNLSPKAGLVVGALPDGAANAFLNDRPSTGSVGTGRRPGTRENASTRPAMPGNEIRPGQGLQSNAGSRPDRSSTRPANVARLDQSGNRDFAQNLPSRITDNEQREIWRHNIRDGVGEYLRVHADSDKLWYGDEWYLYHHLADIYSPNYNYWSSASWPNVTTWVDYGLSKPVYYNYGENVYYQNGSVYYGDQPVATEQEYADQAEAIATNVPEQKPAADDWMPLGVFAIAPDGKPTGAEPHFFLQLAVSKQGLLSGSLQNTVTNKVQAIEGMVDKQTQRAAWTATGKTRPLMETGIVNLTKETTPTLVHFADGTTQQWLLVRVEKPGTGANSATSTADRPK